MSQSKVVAIVGMHRSGTSLMTSWFEKCGLQISNGRLIGSNVGNIKGHFEDMDFYELQASALKSTNPKSRGWLVEREKEYKFSPEGVQAAKGLIEARNLKYDFWGWKDPRTIFFLREWKKLISNLKIICVWRPLGETIDSLLRRARTPGGYEVSIVSAIKTWNVTNRAVINIKNKYPNDTAVMPLDYLINNDKDVITILKKNLDLPFSYTPIRDIYDKGILGHPANFNFIEKTILNIFRDKNVEKQIMGISDIGKDFLSNFNQT